MVLKVLANSLLNRLTQLLASESLAELGNHESFRFCNPVTGYYVLIMWVMLCVDNYD
jgi:hypothetical protein